MAKVSTSVSSVLRTKMPSFKKAPSSKFPALKTVKMPKNTVSARTRGILSSKTLRGTAVKTKKPSVKVSSVQASLKSLISKSKKIKPSAMARPSSAPPVPSPAFFGRPNISGM